MIFNIRSRIVVSNKCIMAIDIILNKIWGIILCNVSLMQNYPQKYVNMYPPLLYLSSPFFLDC